MLAGDLAPVARAALVDGDAALSRFVLQPFQPVQPMLADSAADVGEALADARRGVVRIQARWRAHPGAQGRRRGAGLLAQPARRHDRGARSRRPSRARCRRARSCSTARRSRCAPDGTPHPFQVTMRRFGRKLDVDALQAGAADHAVLLRRALSSTATRSSTSRSSRRVGAARRAGRAGEPRAAARDGRAPTRRRRSRRARSRPATKA